MAIRAIAPVRGSIYRRNNTLCLGKNVTFDQACGHTVRVVQVTTRLVKATVVSGNILLPGVTLGIPIELFNTAYFDADPIG